jgi:hypothetical protein
MLPLHAASSAAVAAAAIIREVLSTKETSTAVKRSGGLYKKVAIVDKDLTRILAET